MFSKFLKLPWSKKPAAKDPVMTSNKKIETVHTAAADSTTRNLIDQPITVGHLQSSANPLEMLLEHTPAQRHAALTTLNDEILLRQLARQSDKLDKRSNQIIREQVKALREKEQQQKALEEKIEKLCLRLESLSRTQHNALFDSELFQLEQTWQHFLKENGDKFGNLISRGKTALTTCQTIKSSAEKALAEARITTELEAAQQAEVEASKKTDVITEETNIEEQPSALLDEINAAKKAIDAEKQKLHEEKQQQFAAQLENYLPKLEKAIEDRDLKKSRELANQLQNAIRQLEPKRANAFSGKLQLLQNQLKELQDWQEFATLPKLEQLCASMEQLITTSLPAPQKAAAIRELQEQWRSMKVPQSTTAQELWARFKQASDTAYAPCAEYFANEKSIRAFNLAQRQTICDSLEAFYQHNWGTDNGDTSTRDINWKGLIQILGKAREEFYHFHPVERHEEKPLKERFEAACKNLNNELEKEYQRNENAKQVLIDDASQLINSEDLVKAIGKTRELQQQWKTIGPTRRNQDQQLWKAFQSACNAVFEKRQQNREQQQQQRELEKQQREEQLRQEKARQEEKLLEQQRLQQNFQRLVSICEQLEYGNSNDTIDALSSEWETTAVDAAQRASLRARFDKALAIARGEASTDFYANEQQRRQLLIELEILTNSDTPEEDRQQRRDYQMQTLQKNFGKTTINPREQKEKLVQDWYALGAAAATVQPQLQARFDKLQKSL